MYCVFLPKCLSLTQTTMLCERITWTCGFTKRAFASAVIFATWCTAQKMPLNCCMRRSRLAFTVFSHSHFNTRRFRSVCPLWNMIWRMAKYMTKYMTNRIMDIRSAMMFDADADADSDADFYSMSTCVKKWRRQHILFSLSESITSPSGVLWMYSLVK